MFRSIYLMLGWDVDELNGKDKNAKVFMIIFLTLGLRCSRGEC